MSVLNSLGALIEQVRNTNQLAALVLFLVVVAFVLLAFGVLLVRSNIHELSSSIPGAGRQHSPTHRFPTHT